MKVTQERDELPNRALTSVGLGLVLATALFIVAAWLLLRCNATPYEPARNQAQPDEMNQVEMIMFDNVPRRPNTAARQRALLHSYGWVSRDQGVVHIPIERAIQIYLDRLDRNAEEGS